MAEAHELAEDWLRFAREDLGSATAMVQEPEHHRPRHAYFAAQQAAEKAIKAVCVAEQIPFPFSHDLEELTALLGFDHAVTQASSDLEWLSQGAVENRYPDVGEPDWPDAKRALEAAGLVVEAAGHDIEAAR